MRGGAEYFTQLTELIQGAAHTLHLQTYIMEADETGCAIADALMQAANRGVCVYLLLDGFASRKLPEALLERMRMAGVQVGFFKPLLYGNLFYIGRRLHHKIAIADGHAALVAGINICNRYNDMPGRRGWLDWAALVEGDAARELHYVAVRTWNLSVGRKPCPTTLPVFFQPPDTECLVRVRRNDWVYRKTGVTKTYRDLLRLAKKEIVIMTSYFWPPRGLLKLMAEASARGVRVVLILSAKADEPLSKQTEKYLYHFLLRHGICIYEYQTNILHGKLAVCDREVFTIGSYNLNALSAFASVELNLDIRNEALAGELVERLEKIIYTDCRQVRREEYQVRHSPLRLFFYLLCYRLTMLLFFLFTFYYRQKRDV